MNKIIFIILILIMPSLTWAGYTINSELKTATTDTCDVASVQNAINDAAVTSDFTWSVIVSSGTCTWGTKLANTKRITLQGAGIDSTIINCGTLAQCINMNVTGRSPLWRITGFSFTGGSGFDGLLHVSGAASGWRIDNNRFFNWNSSRCVYVPDSSYGVFDHNLAIQDTGKGNQVLYAAEYVSSSEHAWASWLTPYTWGTLTAIFFENNEIKFRPGRPNNGVNWGGWATDGAPGGRFVVRYNNFLNTVVTWHGADSSARGAVGGQVYNNYFYSDKNHGYAISRICSPRSGILAFHGNVIKGFPGAVISSEYRAQVRNPVDGKCGSSACIANEPNLWTCSTNNAIICNPTTSYYSGKLYGDAWCASRRAGVCNGKFCQYNRDKGCTQNTDCTNYGGGQCNQYWDGLASWGTTTVWPSGYPGRDMPGHGPGLNQGYQPQMSWGNNFCTYDQYCTPVPTTAIIASGDEMTVENREFFNCTSQSDCETKVNTFLDTVGQSHISYAIPRCPHPLVGSGSCDPSVAGMNGYTLGGDSIPPVISNGLPSKI